MPIPSLVDGTYVIKNAFNGMFLDYDDLGQKTKFDIKAVEWMVTSVGGNKYSIKMWRGNPKYLGIEENIGNSSAKEKYTACLENDYNEVLVEGKAIECEKLGVPVFRIGREDGKLYLSGSNHGPECYASKPLNDGPSYYWIFARTGSGINPIYETQARAQRNV